MLRVCTLLVLLAPLPALADLTGPVRVIDGDTLVVGETRVRLHGVDAPEADQTCRRADGQSWRCGAWASREVRARYQGKTARCAPIDRDRYGRVVARCRVGGRDIARDLTADGVVLAFPRYSDAYVAVEKRARKRALGLHAGTYVAPQDHRKAQRAVPPAPTGDCRIKGNISKSGTRIYHLPGQRFYASTSIRPNQGERWFCTEAEARAAGWRRARS